MPFIITSTTFADEFNTGTTSNFTNGNLADEWTAVINVEYSNIIDAGSGTPSASQKWISEDSSNYPSLPSSKQIFRFEGSGYANEKAELLSLILTGLLLVYLLLMLL